MNECMHATVPRLLFFILPWHHLTIFSGYICNNSSTWRLDIIFKERILEIEARRDSALSDIDAAAAAVDSKLRSKSPEVSTEVSTEFSPKVSPRISPWKGAAAAIVAVEAAKLATSSPFWQECGGQ